MATKKKMKNPKKMSKAEQAERVWSACFSTICAYREETLVLAEVMLNVAKEINRPELAQMAHVLGVSLLEVIEHGRSTPIPADKLAAFEQRLALAKDQLQ